MLITFRVSIAFYNQQSSKIHGIELWKVSPINATKEKLGQHGVAESQPGPDKVNVFKSLALQIT